MAIFSTMDQIPTPRQSNQNALANSQGYPSNVVSGNLLVVEYYTSTSITTPTIADTRGSTWTLRASPSSGAGTLYVWTATAASSGANTVTITQTGAAHQVMSVLEYSHVTELIDNVATATPNVASSTITFPNVTTTHYRDLILEVSAAGGRASGPHNVAYTADFVAEDFTTGNPDVYWQGRLSGDPGTVAGSVITTSASNGSGTLAVVLAIRSTSALTVSTPSIPDAVVSQAYSFQMQATGGAGTNVWTITSGVLPLGLSLSSGGVISGTPTASNGNTITFKVTDSAAATSTANLTLHVGATVDTITRVNGASGATLNGVTAGNIILVGVMIAPAFAAIYGQTSILSDGLGTAYTLVPGATNDLVQLFWGIAASSGNITLSVTPTITSGFTWVSEWTHIQPVFDTGVASKYVSTTGSSPVTSAAITTPVAGMLYALASPGTQTATVTVSAPFSRDINASGGVSPRQSESDYYVGASAGSNTATWTQTGNTSNQLNMTLVSFRPTVSGTAPATGNIVIQKVTNPGGSLQSFTFTPDYGSPFNLTDGGSNDSGALVAGTYSVVETPVSGWVTTTSSDPSAIVVTAGNTTTVTFTNTQQGKIVVEKVTAPVASPQSFDFTTDYGAPFSLLDGQSNTSAFLDAGTYSVTETPVAGWVTTTNIDPSAIVLGAGQTVTVTFTNTQDGNIIIQKVTDPPGSPQSFDFTTSYGSPFSLLDGETNDSGLLVPGTYSVTEAPVIGWATGTSQDPSAIVLGPGETVTVTFSNSQVQGNIIIVKATNPAGSTQSFDFNSTYGSPFSLLDGQSNDSGLINSGTYSVTETPVTGWVTTTDIDPSNIVLVAGETITITFTNSASRIIVQKVTDPPGSDQSFDFTTSYGSPFSLTDGTSNDSGLLLPNTYSVSEAPVLGWTISVVTNPLGIDPAAIPLGAGDTVVVTFTNTQTIAPVIPCGKVLTRVDTWELDNGDPTWAANDSVPIAWYDSNLEQQKVGITRPSQNGTIGLLYIQLAATLTGSGVAMTIPDDWTPYVLWGALADLLSHDGPAYDPLRAKYCEQRYQEGVELARLVLKGV